MKKGFKRIYCEDISPTIKEIISFKQHKHIIEIKGNTYERIGKDMLFCVKSFRIFKLQSLE